MADLQPDEQAQAEAMKSALDQERRLFEVLMRDYTSVFHLDLDSGMVEALKIDSGANAARFAPHMRKMVPYHALVDQYIRDYVTPETRSRFDAVLDLSYIKRSLANKERLTFRYDTVPNARGFCHFECQVIRVDLDDDPRWVLVGFHYIDEVVNDEIRHQRELEEALASARLNAEVVSAISRIYASIFRINLVDDVYEEISSVGDIHRLTGREGVASKKLTEWCAQLVSPEYRERMGVFFDLSTLADRLSGCDTVALEYRTVWSEWKIARFIAKKRNDAGEVTHVLFCTRSIEEEKRREEGWMTLANEAAQANEAKTEFLSRMAHDIRTPMSAIRGLTEIALSHPEDAEKVKDDLKRIDLASSYLKEIVDDVLDLSRIENGRMDFRPESHSVTRLFHDFADSIDSVQNEKTLHFDCRLENIEHDAVYVDPLRVRQILMNLLSNAVKYTQDGGSIAFVVGEEEASRADLVRLVFEITDTGIGMSSEFMEHMYDRFAREVDTRENDVQGTGLGLSIVKELVHLAGGTISCKSELGKGTTFVVKLDVPISQEAHVFAAANGEDPAEYCRGMHLLVAEDNNLNYEIIEELLAAHDITCSHVLNGAECIEAIATNEPGTFDAVLMDMMMPVMGGLQATRIIRSLSRPDAKTLPIVAVTANAFVSDEENCLSAGMNAHLAKPIDLKKLFDLLARLVPVRRNQD